MSYEYQYEPPRPKRRRWPWIVATVVLGLIALGGVIATAEDEAVEKATNDISEGLGSQDASADVKVVSFTPDGFGGNVAKLEVTNNSSKTSDYYIELNIHDANGVVLTFTNATVQNLQPGAKASVDAVAVYEPGAVEAVVTVVQRTESI